MSDYPGPDADLHATLDRVNAALAENPWCDFTLVELSNDLHLAVRTGESFAYDLVIVLEGVAFVQARRHWSATDTHEPVLVLAGDEERRRVHEPYGIEEREGYHLVRVRAFEHPGPMYVSARSVRF